MTDHEAAYNPDGLDLRAERFVQDPAALQDFLESRGAFQFEPYASGLFPASALTEEMRIATGMGMAWLRDNAHVGNALYLAGQESAGIGVGQAMLTVLHQNRPTLDGIVSGQLSPLEAQNRLVVRVQGNTLENDREHRVQNDSTGYALWLTCKLINDGAIEPSRQDIETLAQTVRYLDTIHYWQDADDGHWEEDRRVHVSSIGAVVAGLSEAERMFDRVRYSNIPNIQEMERKGRDSYSTILRHGLTDVPSLESLELVPPNQQPFPQSIAADQAVHNYFKYFNIHNRRHDAALLFLIEPLGVLQGEQALAVVEGIERNLRRANGFARYEADTYWGPNFKHLLPIEERTFLTGDDQLDNRNQTAAGVGYTGTEAQWTLFDPILSTIWGKEYEATHNPRAGRKQLFYLNRMLNELVPTDNEHASAEDKALRWPEAFFLELVDDGANGHWAWVPNDHTPLLWTQANALLALRQFAATAHMLAKSS